MTSQDVITLQVRWSHLNWIAFEKLRKQTSFPGENKILGTRLKKNRYAFPFFSVTLALHSFAVALSVKQEAQMRKYVFGVSDL